MSEPAVCPKCQSTLPINAPGGICPKCLLNAGFPSEPAAAGFTPPSPSELSATFPDLEITELLGKGGMGAVYRAQQKRLDRTVAVKILPPEVGDDPAFAARFTREARMLARLNHPNIVQVYDFGQNGQYFYFVMEFVDGSTLRHVVEEGGIKPEEALAIVPHICEALQFAHDQGIVHRDIKPENILIDTQGRVRIADFGLAMLLDREPADITLTAANQVMGTPHYMAPEQMRGSHAIDQRADIYSLGVVFYELLTGELPIGRFEAPSRRLQVDVRLDEVVLRALAADPDRRYQKASDVQHDVEQLSSVVLTGSGSRKEPASFEATVHSDRVESSSARSRLLIVFGNLWLAGMILLLVGKQVARTQPLMYSFFDTDAWMYPSSYHSIVLFSGLTSLGCFLFAWRGRRRSVVDQTATAERSAASLAPTTQMPAGQPHTVSQQTIPRFSRQAILGAFWASFFFISMILSTVVTTDVSQASGTVVTKSRTNLSQVDTDAGAFANHVEVTPVGDSPDSSGGRTLWQWFLMLTVLPLGLSAPFGTTILGLVATSNIRHSNGALTGLPLAVADTLLFPLLIIDTVVGVAVFYSLPSVFGASMNLPLAVLLSLIPGVILDVIVARACWNRAIRPIPVVAPVHAVS